MADDEYYADDDDEYEDDKSEVDDEEDGPEDVEDGDDENPFDKLLEDFPFNNFPFDDPVRPEPEDLDDFDEDGSLVHFDESWADDELDDTIAHEDIYNEDNDDTIAGQVTDDGEFYGYRDEDDDTLAMAQGDEAAVEMFADTMAYESDEGSFQNENDSEADEEPSEPSDWRDKVTEWIEGQLGSDAADMVKAVIKDLPDQIKGNTDALIDKLEEIYHKLEEFLGDALTWTLFQIYVFSLRTQGGPHFNVLDILKSRIYGAEREYGDHDDSPSDNSDGSDYNE